MEHLINQQTCKKCKLCIEICPCNILAQNEKKEIYFKEDRKRICISCGHCMAICSTKSIKVNGFEYDKEIFDLPKNNVSTDEFYNFIVNRRSIRNFKDKPVPDELIEKIIDLISFAPFGSAPNKVHITVINNRKKIEEALPAIAKFLDNIVKWVENPFMRFMIKKRKGIETLNTVKNHLYPIAKAGNYKLEFGDRITRGAPALLIFHANTETEEHTDNSIIYTVYAMIAAHSLGLGATIISLVPSALNKDKKVKEIFQIPEGHEAISSVILGYPKYKFKRAIKREKTNVNWIN